VWDRRAPGYRTAVHRWGAAPCGGLQPVSAPGPEDRSRVPDHRDPMPHPGGADGVGRPRGRAGRVLPAYASNGRRVRTPRSLSGGGAAAAQAGSGPSSVRPPAGRMRHTGVCRPRHRRYKRAATAPRRPPVAGRRGARRRFPRLARGRVRARIRPTACRVPAAQAPPASDRV